MKALHSFRVDCAIESPRPVKAHPGRRRRNPPGHNCSSPPWPPRRAAPHLHIATTVKLRSKATGSGALTGAKWDQPEPIEGRHAMCCHSKPRGARSPTPPRPGRQRRYALLALACANESEPEALRFRLSTRFPWGNFCTDAGAAEAGVRPTGTVLRTRRGTSPSRCCSPPASSA